MNWTYKTVLKQKQQRARQQELLEWLFLERGLESAKQRQEFLSPPVPGPDFFDNLPDLDLLQLKKAIARIQQAIGKQQPILVYGDYDCDGICATAILWETLHRLGAVARPFIPKRDEHGYGLSESGLKEALSHFDQTPLVVTVDNGIAAGQIVKQFPEIEFVITDHHQPPAQLPAVTAIVHTQKICGSGVAWILASQLEQQPVSTELVALATVCDMLPLIGPNRQLLVAGLKELRHTRRPGLVALVAASGIQEQSSLDTYHLGFVLGPRINAVGRLGHGIEALRLLCTQVPSKAANLAHKLSELNKDRQDLTAEYVQIAQRLFDQKNLPAILVVENEQFHEGIIGLVASKLVELFHRPAVVISRNGDTAKGSARSVPGVDITQLLAKASNGQAELGGHFLAAGFKIQAQYLAGFISRILDSAEMIDAELLSKTLAITARLETVDLDLATVELLEPLAPFGFGNERPLFSAILPVTEFRPVGRDQKHVQVQFSSGQRGIGFNFASRVKNLGDDPIEWAFSLEKNTWRGVTNLQLALKDFRFQAERVK